MKGSPAALAAAWAARNACWVPLVMPLNFVASSWGVECEVFSQSSSSVPAGGLGEEDFAVDGFEGVVDEAHDGDQVVEDEPEVGPCDCDVLPLDAVDCDVSDGVGLSVVCAAAAFWEPAPGVPCGPWPAIAAAVPGRAHAGTA